MANLPPRPPGGGPPRELPPAGQRRLPDGRRPDHLWSALWANKPTGIRAYQRNGSLYKYLQTFTGRLKPAKQLWVFWWFEDWAMMFGWSQRCTFDVWHLLTFLNPLTATKRRWLRWSTVIKWNERFQKVGMKWNESEYPEISIYILTLTVHPAQALLRTSSLGEYSCLQWKQDKPLQNFPLSA